MSLRITDQDNLFGAHVTMKGFLPEDDPMVVFSKEIYPLFSDKDFEDCYSEIGRGAKSPSFLIMVTLLQYRENLSDEETAEACVKRIDWKIALHLPFDAKQQFDSSTLCKFRNRLKANDKSSIAFDKILETIEKKGFIKKNTNQRIDATHIVSHVNRISTTDLLFRTVKCLVEEIKIRNKTFHDEYLLPYIKERYEGKFSSFGMSKEKRIDKMSEIVEDGLYIKDLLAQNDNVGITNFKQLTIMETIFNENVIVKKKEINSKEFVEVEEIHSPKQTIFDPKDTSLQLGVKGKTSWVGSKCHIAETAVKGKVNFVTGMIYQGAKENDQLIHEIYRSNNKNLELKPEKIFADGNYISGKAIFAYKENEQKLMGRLAANSSRKGDEFKLEKFQVDLQTMTAICPMGNQSEKYSLQKDGTHCIYFPESICIKCINCNSCAGNGRDKRRRLNIHKHYDLIRERRIQQGTVDFKKEMRVRAQVEGTISELVRKNGLRYAKYSGKEGHQFQFYMAGAALNVKRIIKALTKGLDLVPVM